MGSKKTHTNLWSHHLFIASLLNLVQFSLGSPVFLTNPNLPHFQSGRNIRHLPCLVRRTGLEGVCMFVTDCMKANGTHLGTCIDRFYFGSCCQIWPDDPFITHEINDNSIDQNTISHFQHHQLTSTTSSTMSPQFHVNTLIPVPTITLPSHYVNKTIATSMSTSISSSMSSSSSSSSSSSNSNSNNFNYNNRKNITHSNNNLNSNKNNSPVSPQIITTTVTTPNISYQYSTEKIPNTSIKTDITIDENNNAIFTYHTDNLDDKNPSSTTETIKIQTFQSVQDEITSAPTTATPITTAIPTTTTTTTTTTTKRPTTTTNTPTTSTPRTTTTTTTTTTTRKPATTTIRATTRKPARRPTTKPTRTTIKQSTTAFPPRRTRPTASIHTTSSKPYSPTITTRKPHRTTKRPNTNTTIKKPVARPISTKRPLIEHTTTTSPPSKPSVTTNKKTTNRVRPTISTTTTAAAPTTTSIRPIIHQHKNKTNTTNKINQSSTISSSSTTAADKFETITKLPGISLTTTEKSKLPSKKRPTTTAEPDTLITISYVETTKAPRPKPKPTAEIVHVPATNLDHTLIDEQQNIPNKSDSITTTENLLSVSNTNKIDSTTIAEKPVTVTKRPTAVPVVTEKKPLLSQATTTESPIFISTQIINENQFINPNIIITSSTIRPITTSTMESPGLVTWSNFNEKFNVTLNQDESLSTSAKPITLTTDWVLIPSIEHDIITNTEQTFLTSSTKPQESSSNSILPDITDNTEITSSESIDSTSTTITTTTTTTQKPPTKTTTQKTKPTLSNTSPTIYTENPTESNVINNNEITTSSNAIIIDNNKNITSTSITTITPPTTITTDTQLVITNNNNDTTDAADGESSTVQYENTTISDVTTVEAITAPSLEGIDYKLVCGKRMFPEPRIVGGSRASFGRWPWQISLRQWRTSTYLHKCGAALLNENWAITAAHCVDNVPPADLLLRLGEFDLVEEEEPYGYQERRVQIVASHPQFDPRTFEYDLALLRFYEPVIFQPNIIPVCVPETDENFIGRTAYVTGWGRLYEDGPLPSVLQEVSVPVINNTLCEGMYRSAGYIEHIPHIFICAGWKKGGYDSCEGDSGGPMVIQRDDRRFLLAGVISWGIGCAEPNQPGVYTRISEFRDWINQILQF